MLCASDLKVAQVSKMLALHNTIKTSHRAVDAANTQLDNLASILEKEGFKVDRRQPRSPQSDRHDP